MYDKHYCKICDKYIGSKGMPKHLKSHDKSIVFLDYVKNNLEDFANYEMCPVCNLNVVQKYDSTKTKDTCSRKCRAALQAERQKGRNIWDIMSEETKIEAKRKISEYAFIKGQGVNIWERMPPETYAAAKVKHKAKAKINSAGEKNPMFGKTHTHEAIQKIFKRRGTTAPEQQVKDFLDKNNIPYKFQFFKKHPETGKTFIYDFHISETNLIIEVDGDFWHGGPSLTKYCTRIEENKAVDEIKTDLAAKLGFKLLRFWESEIKTNPEKLNNILKELKLGAR